jgi:F0F1-type ATP synthase alpha subunit
LVVVERVSDLIHDVVGMLEKAHYSVVEFNTHIVAILLQAERAEVEVLQPVIIYLLGDRGLNSIRRTRSSDSIILHSSIQADHK